MNILKRFFGAMRNTRVGVISGSRRTPLRKSRENSTLTPKASRSGRVSFHSFLHFSFSSFLHRGRHRCLRFVKKQESVWGSVRSWCLLKMFETCRNVGVCVLKNRSSAYPWIRDGGSKAGTSCIQDDQGREQEVDDARKTAS